jgi:hypothetical protein
LSDVDTKAVGALAFAVGRNVKRRHLSPSQKAVLAAETIPAFEKEAKARQLAALKQGARRPVRQPDPNGEVGRSTAKAAKAAGVSETNVKKARRLLKADPGKAAEVKAGKTTVHKALSSIPAKPGMPPKPKQLTLSSTLRELTNVLKGGPGPVTVPVARFKFTVRTVMA